MKRTLRTFAVAAVFACGLPGIAQRRDALPVEVRVAPGDVSIGSTVVVEIYVGEARDIAGVQFALEYDPTILQPASEAPWSPGDIWTSELIIDFWNGKVDPSVNGTETGPNSDGIAYVSVDLGPASVVRGPGVIARAQFSVVGIGTCPLRFPNPWGAFDPNPGFFDSTGVELPVTATEATFSNVPLPSPPPDSTGTDSGGGGSGGGCAVSQASGPLFPILGIALVALGLLGGRHSLRARK